jgi:hypothetical protein
MWTGGSDKVIETRSLLFVLPLKDTMLARITRRIVSNYKLAKGKKGMTPHGLWLYRKVRSPFSNTCTVA